MSRMILDHVIKVIELNKDKLCGSMQMAVEELVDECKYSLNYAKDELDALSAVFEKDLEAAQEQPAGLTKAIQTEMLEYVLDVITDHKMRLL